MDMLLSLASFGISASSDGASAPTVRAVRVWRIGDVGGYFFTSHSSVPFTRGLADR